ncbi:MAG TPA: hypothetical protein VF456_24155 [Vicinamibacterales bacterium]
MATRANRPAFGPVAILGWVALEIFSAADVAAAQTRRMLVDRGPIQNLDLYWGSASPSRAPVSPFTFVSEDLGGTNPKAILRDANGVLWGAKWDEEVHAEVAATRLAWAMGLQVEETYYVEDGQIIFPKKRPTFHRLGSFIHKTGRFRSGARFERRDRDVVSKGSWDLGRDPGTADGGYSILILMNVVLANWDAKNANTKILSVAGKSGPTDWYIMGDYGASFGKMGGQFSHSKYKLRDYVRNKPVITSVDGRTAHLGFSGNNSTAHASVSLEAVRWFAQRASGLRLKQVEDAFRGAHASDADVHGFAQATYERIQEVVRVAGPTRLRAAARSWSATANNTRWGRPVRRPTPSSLRLH